MYSFGGRMNSVLVWSVYALDFAFQEKQVRVWLLSVADSAQWAFASHIAIFTCSVFIQILLLLYAETVVKVKIALKGRMAFDDNLDILQKMAKNKSYIVRPNEF